MAKDDRLYAKFTLDFPDSPKILPLPVEAKWAYVEMVIYSRRLLTDGYLSKPLALAKWGLEVCLALCTNDPVKPSLIELENGYQIHDFAEIQSTRAEIEALTEKRKAAGSKGGAASAEAKRKQVLEQNASKINPETETETETKEHVPQLVGGSGGIAKPRRRSAPRAQLPDGWHPDQDAIQRMRAQYPHLDLKAECEAFTNHHQAHGNVMADWTKAFWTWLGNTNKFGPNGKTVTAINSKPPHKMRVLAELAAKQRAAEDAQAIEGRKELV